MLSMTLALHEKSKYSPRDQTCSLKITWGPKARILLRIDKLFDATGSPKNPRQKRTPSKKMPRRCMG